jgi:hypothetical protein
MIYSEIFNFSLVKSSSTEHLSGADVDLGSSVGIEREPPSRGTTTFSSPNVQIEPTTSKQRRDKMTNKNQQDEEEERGKIIHKIFFKMKKKIFFLFFFSS